MTIREYAVQSAAEGFHFLEGPRWHKGQLYFSDFAAGTVFVLKSNGRVQEVCHAPKWVAGRRGCRHCAVH